MVKLVLCFPGLDLFTHSLSSSSYVLCGTSNSPWTLLPKSSQGNVGADSNKM